MDVVSHGLWGGVAFGRKNKKTFWLVFGISILPDALSFGIYWLLAILGIDGAPRWGGGHMDNASIPMYVHMLYNITHSLIIFGAVFLFVYLLRRKPFWLLAAWGMHILIDIPTHAEKFFPTPFLWPVSSFHIDGISWVSPVIFFPNLIGLSIVYTYYLFIFRKRKNLPR